MEPFQHFSNSLFQPRFVFKSIRHTHTHTPSQDELVEYHMKHGRFPEEEVKVTKRPWTDIVVLMWLAMVGAPALLSGLYLVWIGNWLVLGIIVSAVILGE